MNIVKENVDELNAVLKVKLSPEDYQTKVETTLKNYSKKANIPGFRPGKVPAGMVKKMYGKAVLVEEVNKVLNDSVYKYINENNIEILGGPIPKSESSNKIDWDNQKEFEFLYELGLAPQFKVELSKKDKFNYSVVKVDDALIDKYVDDISKRYGKIEPTEVSDENSMLFGDLVEVDSTGTIIPGGIFRSSSLFNERYKGNDAAKVLIGLKKDDKVIVDIIKLADNVADRAAMLGIDKEAAEQITNKFQFTVKTISRLVPSELNQDLFDKVYGKDAVTTVVEFRDKIKGEVEKMFEGDSERRFYNEVVEGLMKKISFKLPDEFLKRWLMIANEKPLTYEEVSSEYTKYADGLKWQLIENKIIKENQIKVSSEEILEYVKGFVRSNFARYGQQVTDDIVDKAAKEVLQKEEEVKKIYDNMYGKKVMDLFKSSFTLERKELSQEDFYKQAQA